MADFLEYVRRRRAELRKELNDLEVAERIYLESVTNEPMGALTQAALAARATVSTAFERDTQRTVRRHLAPKTVQQMVIQILDETYPGGLTALEILDLIQQRWKPDLERTSLSPQLTRLKARESIKNDKTRWFLSVNSETGPSEESNAPV